MKKKDYGQAVMVCLLSLLFAAQLSNAVTEASLTVMVSVNPDASASVTERYSIFLDTDRELEEFTHAQNFGQNTIIAWRKFVPRLRYHVGGPLAATDTNVFARRALDISFRSAVLELEYEVNASLFSEEKVSSRVTKYELDSTLLSFESTATGEVILSPLDTLEITIPARAKLDARNIVPRPTQVNGNSVRWAGPFSSKWEFEYTQEKALEDEVNDFFKQLYQELSQLVPSLLPLALVLLVAAFLFNKFLGSRK